MTRAKAIQLMLLVSCLGCMKTETKNESAQDDRPNIIFLLADDLGYGEIGSYGQQMIKTPVLDSLAQESLRFTNFYAGNAVCSPSRAVLLTGISSHHNAVRGNSGYFGNDLWDRVTLTKDQVTLGEMMKGAGYKTAYFGKWHLGDASDVSTWAHHRGFDYAVQEQWSLRQTKSHFVANSDSGKWEYINGMQDSTFFWKGKWRSEDEYRTNMALNYLDTADLNSPLFLFMSYRAPHKREELIYDSTLYADMGWPEEERIHAAKITLLDEQIGVLLRHLKAKGELDNTMVIFTSDNGPQREGRHDHEFFDSNGALRGAKKDVYEGGIRVPLLVNWAGKITPDVTDQVAGFQDFMPTFSELVGMQIPVQTDGLSMMPTWTGGEQTQQHQSLQWEFQLDGWFQKMPKGGFRQSARIGKWKGVRYGVRSAIELYDLEKDQGEQTDVASDFPEVVQQMEKLFSEESRSASAHYPYGGVVQDYRAKNKYQGQSK
ncbi:MAG: sulfatase-like hydrolase/transferase [Ekhidna sp.]|nr:sulfatase-like hydrolase/transferase [Ekhidna sp.]